MYYSFWKLIKESTMARKFGVVSPDSFARMARRYVGGEIVFSGTDVRTIKGPIEKIERRGDILRVTCEWLAAHFPGRREHKYDDDAGRWKLRRFNYMDISLKHHILMGGDGSLSANWKMPPFLGGGGFSFYPKSKEMLNRSRVVG